MMDRQIKVLAIGSGHLLSLLSTTLLEAGLSDFHVLNTKENSPFQPGRCDFWNETVQRYHYVLYVSNEINREQIQCLHTACLAGKTMLFPAVCTLRFGFAGPLVHAESRVCWESAWRRLHRCALDNPQQSDDSETVCTLLVNLLVFELLKTVASVEQSHLIDHIYLLDSETLVGNWHEVAPHPLADGNAKTEWLTDVEVALRLDQCLHTNLDECLAYFNRLTSKQTGILHTWEEGELNQLPLSQCGVQATDPLTDGPAELLPPLISIALTHKEARREAGLAGIEAHMSRVASRHFAFMGVGAGETFAECLCRGLQNCLAHEMDKRVSSLIPLFLPVPAAAIEDERCRFYLQALTIMQKSPEIGLDQELCGFPVAWVESGGLWYGGVGLNILTAVRKALELAIQYAQNEQTNEGLHERWQVSAVKRTAHRQSMPILSNDAAETYHDAAATYIEMSKSALRILERNGKRLHACSLEWEPFIKTEPIVVYGVTLREELSQ